MSESTKTESEKPHRRRRAPCIGHLGKARIARNCGESCENFTGGSRCIELRNCLNILAKNLSKGTRRRFRYIAAECRPFWPLSFSSIGQSHACSSVMQAGSDHPTRSLLPYAISGRHKLNNGPIALCTESCDLLHCCGSLWMIQELPHR